MMGKSTDFNGAAESRVRCKPAHAETGKITPELRLRTLGGNADYSVWSDPKQ
jgi:hypothetical protein